MTEKMHAEGQSFQLEPSESSKLLPSIANAPYPSVDDPYVSASHQKEPVGSMTLNYLGCLFKRPRLDSDFVDKLNYCFTSAILVFFALLVAAKQYGGSPIQCWVPATFTTPMEQYTEEYCWAQDVYWLPIGDAIPKEFERHPRLFSYYQFIPLILSLQALLFYLPSIAWRGLLACYPSGINLHGIVQMARDSKLMAGEQKSKDAVTTARHMQYGLRFCGCYTTVVYMVIKVVYLANISLQFALINLLVVRLQFDWLRGFHWENSGMLPRVTLCDYEVKVLGNIHRHTVQCVFPINQLNESIYIFLWFWFAGISVATLFNLIFWIITMFLPSLGISFVRRHLTVLTNSGKPVADEATLQDFVNHFLHYDGVFTLRMVSMHAGELATSQLVVALWKEYVQTKQNRITALGVDTTRL